jgi:exosome complex component RRP42
MNQSLHEHLIRALKTGKRFDNRALTEFRKPVKVETGVIKTAEGSAKVTIGETEVIVGIKMEVTKPYPDTPDKGTIIVGAELLPLSSPDFETGPPGMQAIELARVVDRGIRESGTIDFNKLCIEEGEKVWVLLIDICTLNDAGNLMDASALAALAALKDVRFPKYDGEKIDYKEKTKQKLPLDSNDTLEVTVVKVGDYLLVDPTTEEEKVIDARITVSSKKDGTLCALQKGEEMPLTADDVIKMVDLAIEKAKELRGAL